MVELIGACKSRGLMPFTNYNRLHVVPPCTVSETEAKEGLAILDEAFGAIAEHYQRLTVRALGSASIGAGSGVAPRVRDEVARGRPRHRIRCPRARAVSVAEPAT